METLEERLGLDRRLLMFFKLQASVCGQWKLCGLNQETALEYLKRFCDNLIREDFNANEFTEAMYVKCQDTILAKNFPAQFLVKLPPFDEEGKLNTERFLEAWYERGEIGIDDEFEFIFGYPWEEIAFSEYEATRPELVSFLQAAHARYGSVHAAMRVIDSFGWIGLQEKSAEEFLDLVDLRLERRGLSTTELICLALFDGGLRQSGNGAFSVERYVDLVAKVAQWPDARTNAVEFVLDAAHTAQKALMAYRKSRFEVIQFESPFSKTAIENAQNMINAFQQGGKDLLFLEIERILPDDFNAPNSEIIRILEGNGLAFETPIVFTPTTLERRVRAEYWYINYLYGYENEMWSRGTHFTIYSDLREENLSSWTISVGEVSNQMIYFSTAGTIYAE